MNHCYRCCQTFCKKKKKSTVTKIFPIKTAGPKLVLYNGGFVSYITCLKERPKLSPKTGVFWNITNMLKPVDFDKPISVTNLALIHPQCSGKHMTAEINKIMWKCQLTASESPSSPLLLINRTKVIGEGRKQYRGPTHCCIPCSSSWI